MEHSLLVRYLRNFCNFIRSCSAEIAVAFKDMELNFVFGGFVDLFLRQIDLICH